VDLEDRGDSFPVEVAGESVDLDPLVERLNLLVRRHQGLDLALRVGSLYLRWEATGRHTSLRRLGAHPGALLRRSRLTTYVQVAKQARLLGKERTRRLTLLSLHVALLPESDPDRKVLLADLAARDSWTPTEMREAVAEGGGVSIHRRRMLRLKENMVQVAETLRQPSVLDSLELLGESESEDVAADMEEATQAIATLLRSLKDGQGSSAPETP
jgi:hypothetical protein